MREVNPEDLLSRFSKMNIVHGNHFVRAYQSYKQYGMTDPVNAYLIQVRDSIISELEGIQAQKLIKPHDKIEALQDALYILNSLLVPIGTTLQ